MPESVIWPEQWSPERLDKERKILGTIGAVVLVVALIVLALSLAG